MIPEKVVNSNAAGIRRTQRPQDVHEPLQIPLSDVMSGIDKEIRSSIILFIFSRSFFLILSPKFLSSGILVSSLFAGVDTFLANDACVSVDFLLSLRVFYCPCWADFFAFFAIDAFRRVVFYLEC